MQMRAVLSLAIGGLVIGLLGGLAIGGDGGSGSGKVIGPGPAKKVAGVPVGYTRSKEGAVNAALGYEGALGSIRRASKEARAAALNAMAAPDQRDGIAKSAEPGFTFFDSQFGTEGVVRASVLGYRVKTYSEDTAEIELWEVSVVGRPQTIPVRSGWTTRTVKVRWVDGDWKLTSLPEEASGPTPQENGTASDPTQVVEAGRGFEEVRFATAALH